jgi:HPP family/Inner membrane component of T3SS, cytoplasmic domain
MTMYADRPLPADSRSGPPPTGGSGSGAPLVGTLHVLDGPVRGQMWRLSPGAYVLGRAADADLPVKDPGVSRRQCRVIVAGPTHGQPGTITIEDLGSGNGTLVNGAWAGRPTALRPGATIVVGNSTLSWSPHVWRPPASPVPARVSATVAGAAPHVRLPRQMPVHPPAPPLLPAAAPPRGDLASVAVTPAAPVDAGEPATVRLPQPRKVRWPQSAAPARPKTTSTVLSTLTILSALATLAIAGMLTGLPLLFPPLAASMALIAAGSALPLAQPRNVLGGHVVSALVGFAGVALIGSGAWAAALAGAGALGAMLLLRLSHSPAVGTAVIVGATAPAAAPFLELLVLAAVILVAFGILGARLDGKKYPVYWW